MNKFYHTLVLALSIFLIMMMVTSCASQAAPPSPKPTPKPTPSPTPTPMPINLNIAQVLDKSLTATGAQQGLSYQYTLEEKDLDESMAYGLSQWDDVTYRRTVQMSNSPFAFHAQGPTSITNSTASGPITTINDETYYTHDGLYIHGSSGWLNMHTYLLNVERVRYQIPIDHLQRMKLMRTALIAAGQADKIKMIKTATSYEIIVDIPVVDTLNAQLTSFSADDVAYIGVHVNTRVINGEPINWRHTVLTRFQEKIWINPNTFLITRITQSDRMTAPDGARTYWMERNLDLHVTSAWNTTIAVPDSVKSTAVDYYGE